MACAWGMGTARVSVCRSFCPTCTTQYVLFPLGDGMGVRRISKWFMSLAAPPLRLPSLNAQMPLVSQSPDPPQLSSVPRRVALSLDRNERSILPRSCEWGSSGTLLSNCQTSVKCFIANFHQRPSSPRRTFPSRSLLMS